ncbi:MAG: hypothetical protein EA355_09150, partial [Rhodobacteraceae bacterium]
AARFDVGRFRNAPPVLVEPIELEKTPAPAPEPDIVPDGNGSDDAPVRDDQPAETVEDVDGIPAAETLPDRKGIAADAETTAHPPDPAPPDVAAACAPGLPTPQLLFVAAVSLALGGLFLFLNPMHRLPAPSCSRSLCPGCSQHTPSALTADSRDRSPNHPMPVANSLERLNREVKRRADVVEIFPNKAPRPPPPSPTVSAVLNGRPRGRPVRSGSTERAHVDGDADGQALQRVVEQLE